MPEAFGVSKLAEPMVDSSPLPRLSPDTAASAPGSIDEVIDYLRLESTDENAVTVDRLCWLRTAQVAGAKYWLWTYTELSGWASYVFVLRLRSSQWQWQEADRNERQRRGPDARGVSPRSRGTVGMTQHQLSRHQRCRTSPSKKIPPLE